MPPCTHRPVSSKRKAHACRPPIIIRFFWARLPSGNVSGSPSSAGAAAHPDRLGLARRGRRPPPARGGPSPAATRPQHLAIGNRDSGPPQKKGFDPFWRVAVKSRSAQCRPRDVTTSLFFCVFFLGGCFSWTCAVFPSVSALHVDRSLRSDVGWCGRFTALGIGVREHSGAGVDPPRPPAGQLIILARRLDPPGGGPHPPDPERAAASQDAAGGAPGDRGAQDLLRRPEDPAVTGRHRPVLEGKGVSLTPHNPHPPRGGKTAPRMIGNSHRESSCRPGALLASLASHSFFGYWTHSVGYNCLAYLFISRR